MLYCLAFCVLVTDSSSNPLSARAHQSHIMMEPPCGPPSRPGALHLLASFRTISSRTAASCSRRNSLAGACVLSPSLSLAFLLMEHIRRRGFLREALTENALTTLLHLTADLGTELLAAPRVVREKSRTIRMTHSLYETSPLPWQGAFQIFS